MGKAAYCSECRSNVFVTEGGTCPAGHGPECLSGHYDVGSQPAPPAAPPAPGPAAPSPKKSRLPWIIGAAAAVALCFVCGLCALLGALGYLDDIAGTSSTDTEADTPSLEETPDFHVDNLRFEPSTGESGRPVTVRLDVENTGGVEGTFELTLMIDGEVEASKRVTIGGGEVETVEFSVTREAGAYSVDVNGLQATLDVVQPPSTSNDDTPNSTPPPATPAGWHVFKSDEHEFQFAYPGHWVESGGMDSWGEIGIVAFIGVANDSPSDDAGSSVNVIVSDEDGTQGGDEPGESDEATVVDLNGRQVEKTVDRDSGTIQLVARVYGKQYVVTIGTNAGNFGRYEDTFEQIAESFYIY